MLGTKEDPLSLSNLKDGAVIERFDQVMQEVIANIQDPNTNPTAKRQIILTVTFKPDDERFFNKIHIECVPKLPGAKGFETVCVIDTGRGGAIEARELTNPQQKLFESDGSGKVVPIKKGEES